ncbi:MAG: hypothetical protein Q7U76_12905 [Nitrospirota bacterium]|nr:hypothetical protein [Nitrospirota bacterium]
MYTTAFRDLCLGQLGGFVGLLTAISDWRAGTVTEANYTGYGTRPAITYGAAGNTTPAGGRQKANSAAVTFPQNTGSNQDMIGWGVYSASSAGVLHAIGLLDTDPPIFGTGLVNDTIEAFAHGLQTDQRVFVLAAPGAPLPTGLAENTAYFVLAAGLTADVFSLSLTSGGAAVNITVGGCALFMPYKAVTIATNATPEFAIGALVVQQ